MICRPEKKWFFTVLSITAWFYFLQGRLFRANSIWISRIAFREGCLFCAGNRRGLLGTTQLPEWWYNLLHLRNLLVQSDLSTGGVTIQSTPSTMNTENKVCPGRFLTQRHYTWLKETQRLVLWFYGRLFRSALKTWNLPLVVLSVCYCHWRACLFKLMSLGFWLKRLQLHKHLSFKIDNW